MRSLWPDMSVSLRVEVKARQIIEKADDSELATCSFRGLKTIIDSLIIHFTFLSVTMSFGGDNELATSTRVS